MPGEEKRRAKDHGEGGQGDIGVSGLLRRHCPAWHARAKRHVQFLKQLCNVHLLQTSCVPAYLCATRIKPMRA